MTRAWWSSLLDQLQLGGGFTKQSPNPRTQSTGLSEDRWSGSRTYTPIKTAPRKESEIIVRLKGQNEGRPNTTETINTWNTTESNTEVNRQMASRRALGHSSHLWGLPYSKYTWVRYLETVVKKKNTKNTQQWPDSNRNTDQMFGFIQCSENVMV